MKYRRLGRTSLLVSEIGFGGILIQRVFVNEAVEIIKKAHNLGVNFIDTGVVYTDSEEEIVKEKEAEILKILAKEMGIPPEGIKSFENLLVLADYDNIVDLMRILPKKIKSL